jgi:hypothetical protein
MHRIDGQGALPGGHFTEGDPQTGEIPTTVTADWAEALQEEIAAVIEDGGEAALNKLDNGQLVAAIQKIARGSTAFRNVLQNGEPLVMQRWNGIFSTALGAVAWDRWTVDKNGAAGDVDAFRVVVDNPGAVVPALPLPGVRAYGLIQYAFADQPAPIKWRQRIEDARTLSGATATLAIWLRCAAGPLNEQPKLRRYHGGNATPDQNVAGPVWNVSTTWQRFTWTVAVPVCGSIIGAYWPAQSPNDANQTIPHYLELTFEIDTWSGVGFGLEWLFAQLEPGSSASDFERVPYEVELSRCRRYFETSHEHNRAIATWAAGGFVPTFRGASRAQDGGNIAQGLSERFRVSKAKVPVIVWYSPQTAAAATIYWNGGDIAVTGTADTSTEQTGQPTVGGAPQAVGAVYGHWTAEAEL